MTDRNTQSNFESRQVVSRKKSAVRVIKLTLSANAKEKLSSKSPGIRTGAKPQKDVEERTDESDANFACA